MDIVENANKSYEDVKCSKCFNSAERSKCQVDNRDNYNGGHNDRYKEFETFMKMQLEFNKTFESLITSNIIQINKQTYIELKEVEQKCKNQTRYTYAEGWIWRWDTKTNKPDLKSKHYVNWTKISENQSNIDRRFSKSYCQQPGEIRNQVCISEQSLTSHTQDTKKQVSKSEQLFHLQLQNTSNQDTLPWQSVVITELNEKTTKSNQNVTFAVVTSNRNESLVEENCSVT